MSRVDEQIWALVRDRPRDEKGFDHGWGWWSQAALPSLPELPAHDPLHLDRPLNQQDVQGSFQAICELAGFWVAAFSVNPARRSAAETSHTIACELEQMAAALRLALEERLERDDEPTTDDDTED